MKLEEKKGTEGVGKTHVGLISHIQMTKNVFIYVCITCRNQNEIFVTSADATRTSLEKDNISEVLPVCLQALTE